MLKKISYWAGIAIVGTILGLTLQFAKAWTEPSGTPPLDNVGAPITTGAQGQTKTGNLQVNGLAINGTGTVLLVPNGNVGIGTLTPTAKLDVAGNFKTNAFYFDGNDDTWLRLRAADNGAYKDFAAGNLYATTNLSVIGNANVNGVFTVSNGANVCLGGSCMTVGYETGNFERDYYGGWSGTACWYTAAGQKECDSDRAAEYTCDPNLDTVTSYPGSPNYGQCLDIAGRTPMSCGWARYRWVSCRREKRAILNPGTSIVY